MNGERKLRESYFNLPLGVLQRLLIQDVVLRTTALVPARRPEPGKETRSTQLALTLLINTRSRNSIKDPVSAVD